VDPTFQDTTFPQPNPIVIPDGVNGGWAGFGATLTGNSSVALADNSWGPTGVYQIVSGTAGATYTASGWFDNTGNASGFTPYIINVNFDDITGTEIGTGISTAWVAETLGVPEQLSVTGVAPAGTAYVLVYYMAMDNAVNGADYTVSNTSLTGPAPVPEPTTLALLGLGVVGGMIWRRRQ
jgi:hypothetical protein